MYSHFLLIKTFLSTYKAMQRRVVSCSFHSLITSDAEICAEIQAVVADSRS